MISSEYGKFSEVENIPPISISICLRTIIIQYYMSVTKGKKLCPVYPTKTCPKQCLPSTMPDIMDVLPLLPTTSI